MAKGVTAKEVKDLNAIVERLIDTYDRASKEELTQGMNWYTEANEFCQTLAAGTGFSLDTIIGVVSAISPRLGWGPNKERAAMLVDQFVNGKGYKGLGLHSTFELGYLILDGLDPEEAFMGKPRTLKSSYTKTKRQCFYRNIKGSRFSDVTIDTWAIKAALGHEFESPGRYYEEIEKAYMMAAELVGIAPREFQAVVWTVIRNETLTDNRLAQYEKTMA